MAATVTGKAQLPSTAAEVAAAVLDGIQTHPEAFDMDSWAGLRNLGQFEPGSAPACGTTMCAAGWTAHVTGWTLVDDLYENDEPIEMTYSDGEIALEYRQVYATKDGINRPIEAVAREALGLTDGGTFWYGNASEALQRLRQIAGRD